MGSRRYIYIRAVGQMLESMQILLLGKPTLDKQKTNKKNSKN
jgi:hypothetical protein